METTKKRGLLYVCILIFLVSIVHAEKNQFQNTTPSPIAVKTPLEEDQHPFYNITPYCANNTCIQGQPMIWMIEFVHDGSRPVEYVDFEFIDSINHSIIAERHIPYFPLRDDRGDLLVTEPNKRIGINISGVVPKANGRNKTTFYPCFSNTIDDIHVFVRHNDYTFRQCYDDNWTLPMLQCDTSNHCGEQQYCAPNKRCRSLKCDDCQYIQQHQCVNYQCCQDNHCQYNQFCENNTCFDIQCSANEYIDNRTCKQLNCNFDEYVEDNTCKKLFCNETAYVFNHSCLPLQCGEQEYIFNHTCRTCTFDQHVVNGTCEKLHCKINEGYKDNQCVTLTCAFYQDIRNHECKNNLGVIVKTIIEAIIIIVIIVFILLDLKKVQDVRDKKKFGKGIFIK